MADKTIQELPELDALSGSDLLVVAKAGDGYNAKKMQGQKLVDYVEGIAQGVLDPYVERAETAADAAESASSGVSAYAEQAQQSANSAAESATASEDAKNAAESAKSAIENLEVSSATADKVSRKSLSLQLTSTTTLEMNLDVAMTDGTSLLAAYDGLCFNGETGADAITLDKQIFFYYMGDAENGAGTSNYYLAVTNLEDWQGSGENFKPLSEGYILTLDFYGEKGDDWTAFPDGTFTESSGHEAQTYYSASAYSFVTYCAASGTSTDLKLTGEPVTVTRNDNGTVTVTAEFIDVDGNDRTITFTGELNISNGTFTSYLPQIGKDVYFDGIPTEERPGMGATANYYGDLYGVGSGLIEVLMYDTATANNIPGGYAMTVTFCTNTFNDTKNLRIPEGTYQVNETMGQFTALPGSEVEIPLFAIVVPSGTYASYTDETETGYYSYASGGTIKVSQSGDSGYYTLEFDLVTRDGYTITGAYNGDIEISDQSEDDGNDGSTNLEENVEMDLSYLPSASCFPRDQIYAAGLGMIDVDDIDNAELFTPVGQACGYQVIDIGAATGYFEPNPLFPERGKLHEGDVIRMDLLVEPGTEDRITPGTYTVTSNRYPAQMKPGVCVRGYTGTEGNDGGPIWENAENGSPEKAVNNGKGFGWQTVEIKNIIVTDHRLDIGFTNDKFLTGKEWTGTWFSSDDYRLFYVSEKTTAIDAVGHDGTTFRVTTSKGSITVYADAPYKVYNLSGMQIDRTSGLPTGIYMIECNGEVRKVLVP